MPYDDEFHDIRAEHEAICQRDGDMLILQPFATTRSVFEPGHRTGDRNTPGIGIAHYGVEEQRWSGGGVLTRQHVSALRDFLNDFLLHNSGEVIT